MSENCTIQDVFNRFYSDYGKTHELSAAQQNAVYHIMNCKTGAFGVNVSVCEDCGCIFVHYNSCRDRCCPMCQEFPKEKWADGKLEFYGTAEPCKNHYAFRQLLDACYVKEWIPYCKNPFRGAESVIKYCYPAP